MTILQRKIVVLRVTGLPRDTFATGNIHGYVKKRKATAYDINLVNSWGFSIPKVNRANQVTSFDTNM